MKSTTTKRDMLDLILDKCPKCGEYVSDKNDKCIHCLAAKLREDNIAAYAVDSWKKLRKHNKL